MFETRTYPTLPETMLVEFEYPDPDLSEIYTSPFPVIVFSLDRRLLGFGRVIGQLGEVGEPIIEMDDTDSNTGTVHLLGFECLWNVATEEVVNKYSTSPVGSPYEYFRFIDQMIESGYGN